MGKNMTHVTRYLGIFFHHHAYIYNLARSQLTLQLTLTQHRSKNLIYTVVYMHEDGKIIDEIIEHDSNNSISATTNMAYGTNCPVFIDSKYDGIVLLPEQGGGGGTKTFHYTVMIHMTGGQSRYEFGVEAHRIKYRKVVVSPTLAMGEELLVLQDNDDAAAAVAVVATPNHTTVTNAVPPTIIGEAKKTVVVPSSITVEADNNKRKRDEMDESPLTITPRMRDNSHDNVARSIDEDLHKHETSKSSSSGGTHRSSEGINSSNVSRVDDNKIVMTLPEWIQWNRDYCQQDLFCEL